MAETVAPYAQAHAGFRLEDEETKFSGRLKGGLNACVECCDRRVARGDVALEWEDQHGRKQTLTFADLKDRSARFANMLETHGVGPGDVVACMLPRVPDLMTVALGTWRAGAVYQLPKTPGGKIQRFLLRNAEKAAANDAGKPAR
jgi:acetyl-CoA synthetase